MVQLQWQATASPCSQQWADYRCWLLLQYRYLVQAAASTVQCQWIELLAGGTGSLSLPLSVRTMETTTTPSPAPSRVWGFMMVVLVTGPLHMKVIEMLSFPELHVLMGVVEKLVTESGSLYWSSCRRALKWRCWHSEDHQLLPNIAGLLIFLLFSMQLQWYPLLWKDAGRTKNKKLNFEKNIDFEFFSFYFTIEKNVSNTGECDSTDRHGTSRVM